MYFFFIGVNDLVFFFLLLFWILLTGFVAWLTWCWILSYTQIKDNSTKYELMDASICIPILLEIGHSCLPCSCMLNVKTSRLLCHGGAERSFQNVQRLCQSCSQHDLEIIFHSVFLQACIANRRLLYISIYNSSIKSQWRKTRWRSFISRWRQLLVWGKPRFN